MGKAVRPGMDAMFRDCWLNILCLIANLANVSRASDQSSQIWRPIRLTRLTVACRAGVHEIDKAAARDICAMEATPVEKA